MINILTVQPPSLKFECGWGWLSDRLFHEVLKRHTVFTHLYYIPIVLASLWFQRKGLSVAVFLSGFLIFYYLFLKNHMLHMPNSEDYLRALMFVVIGATVSLLSERISKQGEVVRESEEKFRSFAENSVDSIMRYDRQCRHLYVNAACGRVAGISVEEFIGKSHREMGFDKEQYEIWEEKIQKVFETSEQQQYEFEFKGAEGQMYLDWRVVPELSETGEVVTALGISRDISNWVRSEKMLHETRDYLNKLIHYANAPIIVWDPDLKITRFNAAFEHLSGYTTDEVIGQKLDMLFPAESREASLDNIFNTLKHEYWESVEIPILKKNRDVRIALWNSANIYAEDSVIILATIAQGVDITERKQVEEALRESEENYRSMMEAMDDATYICSPDFRVEYMNPAMTRRIGYDATGELCYKTMHGLDEKCPWCIHGEVVQGKHVKTEVVSPKNGKSYHVSSSPIFHTDGSISKLSIFRDITKTKKMEAELQQSQKMETIGTLAGGIAHDFNNILSSIIGYTELSLDDVERGSLIEDHLQEVYKAGKRARDLVKQMLAFARQSDEERKPIQVNTIAEEALKLIRSTIPTSIEIKQNIKSRSLIIGNPTQVHQIFMNLCTNAAHAMEGAGGILEVGITDVEIDDRSSLIQLGLKPGNYMKITISDTGVGIAPDIIGSIFEPYFTTKGVGEGTGMGLALVHGIVEFYAGKIEVKSELGKGTIFSIYLPITKKSEDYRPYEEEKLPSGTERILFVDDELPIAKMGSQILERLGYQVAVRTSSIEALELFRSNPKNFDLVITDMTMPNMTGDKLAVELMKIRSDIPVILCTGYSKTISDDSATAIGIKAFAYKPIVKSDLAKTVRKVLDDQQQEQTTGRILVIDDESEIRKLFIKKLAGRGYEIIEACDGKEGLKLYHENQPDLVITDLVMPEKEGTETITELKREFPNVKIIAISGGGRNIPDAYLQIAKKLGAERTFSKPIDWPELIKAVKELLK